LQLFDSHSKVLSVSRCETENIRQRNKQQEKQFEKLAGMIGTDTTIDICAMDRYRFRGTGFQEACLFGGKT
jgi:hypothetical protein